MQLGEIGSLTALADHQQVGIGFGFEENSVRLSPTASVNEDAQLVGFYYGFLSRFVISFHFKLSLKPVFSRPLTA